ncbi:MULTISPECIES: CAP domain-containing protein [unclassified Thermosynechococcus]|uniref:CAP domain-containing protein n=1 Tax=unclassified Thermosynechococcus TaxID=2622553 RepID=UPI000406CCEC|nr:MULTISPECIES: CAP domain-containing protein [unclassified Thermosynechococcus]HIK23848.1 hypothetical protein [Thermosynechococcus sp. M3746_W2019_013]
MADRRRVNRDRQLNGLPPLVADQVLAEAAQQPKICSNANTLAIPILRDNRQWMALSP